MEMPAPRILSIRPGDAVVSSSPANRTLPAAMRAGRLAGELGREEATEEAVLTLAIPETEPAVEEAQEIGA